MLKKKVYHSAANFPIDLVLQSLSAIGNDHFQSFGHGSDDVVDYFNWYTLHRANDTLPECWKRLRFDVAPQCVPPQLSSN